jgi:acetoin utilization deacetylase AcuC-like enzyme
MPHGLIALDRRCLLTGGAAMLAFNGKTAHASNAATLYISDPAFLLHDPGPFNVERPARLAAITRALAGQEFASLLRIEAAMRPDVEEAILRAHAPMFLQSLKTIADAREKLPYSIDGDTVVSAGTWDAALKAVSAGLIAVDAVFSKRAKNAFCAVRPPGHHAEPARAMGFCFFSNLAIAALYAKAKHGAERIAVVDFDVHHGNGTQKIFWFDRNLFYGSTHQMPLFPGTGAISEKGVGNIFNTPLKAGDNGAVFRSAMEARILPALRDFHPDLILVSAGFDAHEGDPLGGLRLQTDDFAWATAKIMEAADKSCGGRIVSMLEGGYALTPLADSTAAHVRQLMQA